MPAVSLRAGTRLERVHRAGVDALWFGNRDGTWRWDSPDGSYGVLYAGRGRIGSFAETLLRDPAQRDVFWSDIEKRRFAAFAVVAALRLARVHGRGLGWFGVQSGDITEHFDPSTDPLGYARPQELSARIHAESGLDGIQYRSRFDSDELCLALFERARGKLRLIASDQAIDRSWAYRTLRGRGYNLLDL